jgi:hypothetical protein
VGIFQGDKSWGIHHWGTQGSLNIHDEPLGTKSESLASAGSRSSDHLIYWVDHLVDPPLARSVEDLWELWILF